MNRKVSNVLKVLMPLAGILLGLLVSYAGALILDDEGMISLTLISTGIEIIGAILVFFLAYKVVSKFFPATKDYSFRFPKWQIILAIFLIAPLWFIVKYGIVFDVRNIFGSVVLEPCGLASDEVVSSLVESISAVLVAPIIEEVCFRFIPISVFEKKRTKIIVGILLTIVFSLLHVSNFLAAMLDALIFTVLLLRTKNAWYSILMHFALNLTATLVFFLSLAGLSIKKSTGMPIVLFIDIKGTILFVVMAIIGFILLLWSRNHFRSEESPQ